MASYPQVELFAIDPAHQSASSAKSQSASILQSSTAKLITEPPLSDVRSPEPRKISKFFAVLFQLLALLWVGGIGYLLYVNFQQHILGASAWCTFTTCFPQIWAEDASIPRALLARFDHDTHNLLGGLQLAAKAAEIWFNLIAAWLVCLKTLQLAQSPEGLPIGYMLRHIEFANTLSLFDKLTWTTSSAHRRHGSRHRLLFYICLTGLLCVLCNLMGPAVAVLLVPSLQWIDTETTATQRLDTFYAGQPPRPEGHAVNDSLRSPNENWHDCMNVTYMPQGSYHCSGIWANSLDAWVEAVFARQGGITPVASSQNNISFTYNRTNIGLTESGQTDPNSNFHGRVFWVPSRQVLADLNEDLLLVQNMSLGVTPLNDSRLSSFAPYNATVSTVVHRIAPALGATFGLWLEVTDTASASPFYDIELDDDRMVRCYKNYESLSAEDCEEACEGSTSYTRCVELDLANRAAGFWIGERYMQIGQNYTSGLYTRVDHFASDRAAFLPNDTVPHSVIAAGFEQSCLDPLKHDVAHCNWDALFNMSTQNARLASRSRQVNTVHITWDSRMSDGFHRDPEILFIVAIDFAAYRGMANYALDTSRLSNPLMQLDFQPQISRNRHDGFDPQSIAINPNWTLAAWAADYSSADQNPVTQRPDTLDVTRAAPARLQRFFEMFYSGEYSDWNLKHGFTDWTESLFLVPIMQMLSIVELYSRRHSSDRYNAVEVETISRNQPS
ncbi:uncharacterized protein RHO25_003635 [Cercospora beticola]|uniref:Uncharacterized protein n=1 Tax=Cercospora beticola TaxID=122368 RepID=A0ABZ0NHI8_CERBT|nr:hypothetical protein RHO25_003635 [Cercospora beticola]